jgi:arginine deiminase
MPADGHPVVEIGAAPVRRPEPRLYVGSEVGVLRRVLLHRPDLELKRLTPRNKDELLFDDVLWVRRARQEHDAFADALADRGVEVLYLEELLAGVLGDGEVRTDVIERTLAAAPLGPRLTPAVAEWLRSLSSRELAERLIGGIAYDELPFHSDALPALVHAVDGFVLPPLPNHMFTRDSARPSTCTPSIATTRSSPAFRTRCGATGSARPPSSRAATSSSSATAAC